MDNFRMKVSYTSPRNKVDAPEETNSQCFPLERSLEVLATTIPNVAKVGIGLLM